MATQARRAPACKQAFWPAQFCLVHYSPAQQLNQRAKHLAAASHCQLPAAALRMRTVTALCWACAPASCTLQAQQLSTHQLCSPPVVAFASLCWLCADPAHWLTAVLCPAGKGSAATLGALKKPAQHGPRNLHYLGASGVVGVSSNDASVYMQRATSFRLANCTLPGALDFASMQVCAFV
jgi:hypothetical protein